MNKKLRIGIIGCGGITRAAHLPAYAKLDNVEIVALCDIKIEKANALAEEYNIGKTFENYIDMMDGVELDAVDRLRMFHDFYRAGEENSFTFDFIQNMRKGHSFKDYICPDTFEWDKDYFKMGNKYGRVLFLKEYANYIKDTMVAELTDINRNLMMSLDVIPIPMDEAVREVENRRLGVETNITNWQRRQNANNNFSAVIPYDLEQQRNESKEFLDDLTTRD